jgi:hypothetical protein
MTIRSASSQPIDIDDRPSFGTLTVTAWPDPVIDAVGYDPRSSYVETFWLGILGPSTTWLLRRLVAALEQCPEGAEVDLDDTAQCLGLAGRRGRHGPFRRSLERLVQFEMARPEGADVLAVRRRVPPLARRQLIRLPHSLQRAHRDLEAQLSEQTPAEQAQERARRLALSLVDLGEDLGTTEHQLLRWGLHPSAAREASAWAWARRQARPS